MTAGIGRAFCWVGGLLAFLTAGLLAGLRINLTGSIPVGVYVIAHKPPAHGSIVLACLPANVAEFAVTRGYVPRGRSCPGGAAPVGKPILALGGDTVVVTPTGLKLNGKPVPNTAALAADQKGRALPHLARGSYLVESDQVWLVSTHSPLSFDCRYFGAVDVKRGLQRIRPVWTFGRPDK